MRSAYWHAQSRWPIAREEMPLHLQSNCGSTMSAGTAGIRMTGSRAKVIVTSAATTSGCTFGAARLVTRTYATAVASTDRCQRYASPEPGMLNDGLMSPQVQRLTICLTWNVREALLLLDHGLQGLVRLVWCFAIVLWSLNVGHYKSCNNAERHSLRRLMD